MASKNKNFFQSFLNNKKQYPALVGIAAGLYPVLFYYSRNFNMISSWEHFFYFFTVFLCLPVVVFTVAFKISQLPALNKIGKYFLPFLSVFTFLFFLKLFIFTNPERKIIVGIGLIAVLFAIFLHRHLKKFVVFQLLLAFIAFFGLFQIFYKKAVYDDSWTKQPDNIENVVFNKKPNVYFIEPDGYPSFSELKRPFYNIDNSNFENFLSENHYKTYPEFRSNYNITLSSNSATFMMKQHYYDKDPTDEDVENAHSIIMEKNPVLTAFKNNGYETYFLSETPYFLLSRPKLGYAHTNINYDDIAYIHNGMGKTEPVLKPLINYLNDSIQKPKFFFIQLLKPWHIATHKNASKGKEKEREMWIERLQQSNNLIENIINEINKKDPGALVLIMADHGGYVGFDYGHQSLIKTQNRDSIYTIFSTNLSIHWPNNDIPEYDNKLKTPVNIFRILFSYLSENESYLEHLEENGSYIILKENSPFGVYQYIDDAGNIVFKRIDK